MTNQTDFLRITFHGRDGTPRELPIVETNDKREMNYLFKTLINAYGSGDLSEEDYRILKSVLEEQGYRTKSLYL